MAVAENSRSSFRKSLRNPEAGAANIAIRNAEAASSTSLLRRRAATSGSPWRSTMPPSWEARPVAAVSKRRLSGSRRPTQTTTVTAASGTTYTNRQAAMCRSASGSTAKAMPEPSAAQSTSTDMAQARDRAGISSAARITIRMPRAVDSPRATSWVPPRNHNPGARAPIAVIRQLPRPVAIRRLLRPCRSASVAVTRAISTPARTTPISTPWAVLPRPNSSAAKVRVAVRTVPR